MSKIEIYISDEEQREAIGSCGKYVIEEEEISYQIKEYHNKVVEEKFMAFVVYRFIMFSPNEKIDFAWGMSSTKYSQINKIFSEILAEKFTKLVGGWGLIKLK